jgi:hypothetical protein
MQLDWDGYVPFDAGVTGSLRDAPRAVAEDHFARLMAARPVRAAALAALAARHGVALEPVALGTWLVAALPDNDAALASGLIADVSLWLGERIISGTPLRWELFVSHKKATGYQRPVLMGFSKVADPHYYVDVAFMVASWAELAARRRGVRADFLETIVQVTRADA